MARYPSGKGALCKSVIHRFDSDPCLHFTLFILKFSMTQSLPSVESHLSRFLGTPKISYDTRQGLLSKPIAVNLYERHPSPSAITLSTVGLSADKPYELLLCTYAREETLELANLLCGVVKQATEMGITLQRGDILGPAGAIAQGSPLEAFYVCFPNYFSPQMRQIRTENTLIDILWLIPIHPEEAEWATIHGPQALEKLIETQDPDLLDWERAMMALPTVS